MKDKLTSDDVPSHPIRVCLLGASGRLGRLIVECAAEPEFARRIQLVARPSRAEWHTVSLEGVDVVLDVSTPEAAIRFATRFRGQLGAWPAWVSGSTGWTPSQSQEMAFWSERAPLLFSNNFSLGVLAFSAILHRAAPMLKRLGYMPIVTETHHRHKRDAPSGTAKMLQSVIDPVSPEAIPVHSLRAGEVVGDHTVQFFGPSDIIEMRHHAADRRIFARGALEAALWMALKRQRGAPGQYDMSQFLSDYWKI